MYVVTPEEMRYIDRRAIDEISIPGIVLMENAALQTVRVIYERYRLKARSKVVVFAGSGNNGGDGLAIARHLFLGGIDVRVFLIADVERLSGDAKTNFDILTGLKVPVCCRPENTLLNEALEGACLIVDALFGTGLSRPVEGVLRDVIEMVNKSRVPVVSVDIPSGIHGGSGHVMGTAIRATDTVTFGYPKRGHLLYPGRKYTGRLHVVPISLPADSARVAKVTGFTLDDQEVAEKLHRRPEDGHKGTFGKVAVLAGSIGMTGAAYLTSMAALRSGAGLVTLGIPASLNHVMENKLTEVMTLPLDDEGCGKLSAKCIDQVLEFIRDKDVLAAGPGLGKSSAIFEILRNIFSTSDISIVVDADGLNNISNNIKLLKGYKGDVVITPHPGEMSRLTGKSVVDIMSHPVEEALEFSKELGVVVLLKGATTVVANPEGRVYFNQTGNSGMGTGGSGDVLTGIIASLIAQGYDVYEAAVLGCFIHGRAGDCAAKEKGEHGMIAGDILEILPEVMKELYTRGCKSLSDTI